MLFKDTKAQQENRMKWLRKFKTRQNKEPAKQPKNNSSSLKNVKNTEQ